MGQGGRRRLGRALTLATACALATMPFSAAGVAAATPGPGPTTDHPSWTDPVTLGTITVGSTDPEVQAGEVIGATGLIHVQATGRAAVDEVGTPATYGAVYRSRDGGPWRLVGTASTDSTTGFAYFNQDVPPGHTYRYAIEATAPDGAVSWGYSHVMRFAVVDDDSRSLVYHGKWHVKNQRQAYGGTIHITNSGTASVSLTRTYTLLDYVVTVPRLTCPRGCFTIADSSGDIDSQCYQNQTSRPVFRAFADYVAGADTVASTATVTRQYKYPINLDAFIVVNDLG